MTGHPLDTPGACCPICDTEVTAYRVDRYEEHDHVATWDYPTYYSPPVLFLEPCAHRLIGWKVYSHHVPLTAGLPWPLFRIEGELWLPEGRSPEDL